MAKSIKEKIILESISPIDIYGPKNCNINFVKSYFPDLKILARGVEIQISGPSASVKKCNLLFSDIINYLHKYKSINTDDIVNILEKGTQQVAWSSDILFFGHNKSSVQAKSENQSKMISLLGINTLLFVTGPAGTGKTYVAVALAVQALREKKIKKIILTRPAVEAGENLGFLPGDLYDKLSPYMRPLYDALNGMLSKEKLDSFLKNNQIEIVPLAFMRGRTLDNAFVILDEAQNTTINQMKMFLTRMGPFSKFIVCGDISQIDLPKSQTSGLLHAVSILKNINGVGCVEFNEQDVIRHKLVKSIIKAYKK